MSVDQINLDLDLLNAIEFNNLEEVERLIQIGANVNFNDSYTNWTPLISACMEGHIEIVDSLINHSADINMANNNGKTPLMAASESGHANVVELLLKRGANVHYSNYNGFNALKVATKEGHQQVISLLEDQLLISAMKEGNENKQGIAF